MSKFTILGLLTLLGGFVMIGFQALSSVMHADGVWKSIRLVDVLDEGNFTWIEGLSISSLQSAANYIVTMPLFMLLFCLTGFFFVLHFFFGD